MARKMDKRIPVSTEVHRRFRDFTRGAGMTFDEALTLFLDVFAPKGEERVAGAQMRIDIESGKRKFEYDDE